MGARRKFREVAVRRVIRAHPHEPADRRSSLYAVRRSAPWPESSAGCNPLGGTPGRKMARRRRARPMAGHFRTAKTMVLIGEVEDALRALGAQSRTGIKGLADECSHLLTPKLHAELLRISWLRVDATHKGFHSRELFEKGECLFPRELAGKCRTALRQLQEVKERQTAPTAELKELCTRDLVLGISWGDLAGSVSRVLDAMERAMEHAPLLRHVQEAGLAALSSFTKGKYTSWSDPDEAALATRIFKTTLRAMRCFVSSCNLQRDGSAALVHLANPHLVQPLHAQNGAPEQIRVQSARILDGLLSAVEAARDAHPRDQVVRRNYDHFFYHLGEHLPCGEDAEGLSTRLKALQRPWSLVNWRLVKAALEFWRERRRRWSLVYGDLSDLPLPLPYPYRTPSPTPIRYRVTYLRYR